MYIAFSSMKGRLSIFPDQSRRKF